MRTKRLLVVAVVLLGVSGLAVASAQADSIVQVTLNTSPLTVAPASSAGPFSLAFQLIDGSQPNNNTATLTNFTFGTGGSAGSGCPASLAPCTFGGASGDLTSTITLNDSSPFNAFVETFTPGLSLSLLLDLTTNVDSGGTPDTFAFSILDSQGGSIPTLDPSGADTLLTVNIDSSNPAFLTFASDASRFTLAGNGPSITLDSPRAVAAVPEPGSLTLVGLGLTSLCRFRRRR
jgi:hypothetical protein